MAKHETEGQNHTVEMKDRSEMTLSGVNEVISFSDSAVVLMTVCGGMNIKGSSLNIGRLNTDTGELYISGNIDNIRYSGKKDKKGVFEGLFK